MDTRRHLYIWRGGSIATSYLIVPGIIRDLTVRESTCTIFLVGKSQAAHPLLRFHFQRAMMMFTKIMRLDKIVIQISIVVDRPEEFRVQHLQVAETPSRQRCFQRTRRSLDQTLKQVFD